MFPLPNSSLMSSPLLLYLLCWSARIEGCIKFDSVMAFFFGMKLISLELLASYISSSDPLFQFKGKMSFLTFYAHRFDILSNCFQKILRKASRV
jgi:hypothetical protein